MSNPTRTAWPMLFPVGAYVCGTDGLVTCITTLSDSLHERRWLMDLPSQTRRSTTTFARGVLSVSHTGYQSQGSAKRSMKKWAYLPWTLQDRWPSRLGPVCSTPSSLLRPVRGRSEEH